MFLIKLLFTFVIIYFIYNYNIINFIFITILLNYNLNNIIFNFFIKTDINYNYLSIPGFYGPLGWFVSQYKLITLGPIEFSTWLDSYFTNLIVILYVSLG